MSNPLVVEWKWGPVANMKFDRAAGTWSITDWRHPTDPEPNQGQLIAAQAQYDARDRKQERLDAKYDENELVRGIIKIMAEDAGISEAAMLARIKGTFEDG